MKDVILSILPVGEKKSISGWVRKKIDFPVVEKIYIVKNSKKLSEKKRVKNTWWSLLGSNNKV